ncbi:hypothetical protein [Streptomyces sp. SPB074]|uniref:hypothetical protein n=1 Tax=Streptomyces sp. (strain SPB074) TaxID=465543 RepID=UPI001F25825F|nr:hypothetical protein [Streptomyces sp. SPB074]
MAQAAAYSRFFFARGGERVGPGALAARLLGERGEHLGEDGAVRGGARGGDGRLGVAARLLEHRLAALDAPQPQQGRRAGGEEFRRGLLLLAHGAAQELGGVHEGLDHAVPLVLGDEPVRRAERGVGEAAVPGGHGRDGQEAAQHLGGDLGEGLRHVLGAARGGLLLVPGVRELRFRRVLVLLAGVAVPVPAGGRHQRGAAVELGEGEGGEVRAALAEVLGDVGGAVLEDERGLVPAEGAEQRLAHAGREGVPGSDRGDFTLAR